MPNFLADVRIKSLTSSAFYILDFITKEEQVLLQKIETSPKPRWKQLSNRRLQTWPSDLTKNALIESPLPKWLIDPIVPRLMSYPVSTIHRGHIFAESPNKFPNHVHVNKYIPGQGIMPHKDGPAYHAVVCTVSLGAPLCLDIYNTKEDRIRERVPRWKIYQEPQSLITTDLMYTDFLHGIADVDEDLDLNSSMVAKRDLLGSREAIANGRSLRHT